MPLSKCLEEVVARAEPEMVKLPEDQVRQLAAYLRYPDLLPRYSIGRAYYEKSRGITTYHDERNRKKQRLQYLRRLLDYNQPPVRDDRRSRKQGRRLESDLEADRRVHDAWVSEDYRTFADFATARGLSEKEVRKAVDRHRKRLEAAE